MESISIGWNCESAIRGVQLGIRKNKQNGYKTCPFDLMVSNYNGLVKCIREDFKYFCDPQHLRIKNGRLFNSYYNFHFNHESPSNINLYQKEKWKEGLQHYTANNFKNFIIRYDNRINSFRNYLKNKNNYITFIIQFIYSKEPNNDLQKLKDALKINYPKLNYRIIILKS